MLETINIVYIDDDIDHPLSKFLDKVLPQDLKRTEKNYPSLRYSEIKYEPFMGYEVLLRDKKLEAANVAIIDSKLFQTTTADAGMLTGEELRLVLRKYYPFIEVIVITQNQERVGDDLEIISKYDHGNNRSMTPEAYYSQHLTPVIESKIGTVMALRKINETLKGSKMVDAVMMDKIQSSIDGLTEFDEFSKGDIDNLVNMFEEIKGLFDNA